MYPTLESTWGTSYPWEVFGGGPDDYDDMNLPYERGNQDLEQGLSL